jgi:hypothetical protein
MGKVIDMFTRQEIVEMPHSKADGEMIIQKLLELELTRSIDDSVPTVTLISNVISMVESNTGASRYDVMDRIYTEKKA